MGVTLAYQAIPPESSFYARLQSDIAFVILSIMLFDSGHLFNLFEDDPESFDGSMENAFEGHPDVFCGTELETSLLVADFREAIRITRRDYPKIVDITGSLEKSFDVVRDRLLEELSRRNFEDAAVIVDDLLYGDTYLGEHEESFGLATREAVKKGASVLRQIEPEMLFPGGDDGDEGWYSEDFRSWKNFYLSADDVGAEIIMDVH
ncbi:hypothetical protein [Chamaesiphon sp. OTE_8_metabat_110]|uniref:hypothetical protein n=1 Tax=Chamaesiphon sp. OTE_8_metabat_110 TaxID=2964696 RepID=UPI00286AB026|nr:hypothetical protein [Chamaesiphon sp. OTE_8_metabat_110]